ncbi:MAG: beta-galactosidase, partial [Propionibacteriaceae bacterium]|nr:beta-galactosidase [Propionibacteriaceae bacterium]
MAVVAALGLAVTGFVAAPSAQAVDPVPHTGNQIIFPGNDGEAHDVTFDKRSFMIDGERLHLWSGELHHWRVPSQDGWRDVMQKLRAAGFNAVSLYFFWGMHQAEENGEFDFTGPRDIDKLLTMASEEGLYVVARPGPYINAEVAMGGLPQWMVNKNNQYLRSTDPEVLKPSKEWLQAFDQIAKNHQVTDGGGSLLLYQVENELLSDSAPRRAFLKALTDQVIADGITVPKFHNDYGMGGRFSDHESVNLDFYAYDEYPLGFNCSAGRNGFGNREAAFRGFEPNAPQFITEAQGGAFTPWGADFDFTKCAEYTDPAFTRQFGIRNFANGVTNFNYYMIIGGTNWGYTGAPASGFTSYDYGAALNEDRTITPKLAVQKELGYYQNAVPQFAGMDPVEGSEAKDVVGAPVNVLHRQSVDRLDESVTGNGTRFIGTRLNNTNDTTTTTFTLPLTLDRAAADDSDAYTHDDRSDAIAYSGGWAQVANASAFKKTLSTSSTAGAKATYTFNGTGFELIGETAPKYGMATISVDGGTAEDISAYYATDQNAPTQTVLATKTGLAPGAHTVVVTVKGEKDPAGAAGATAFNIDAFNSIGGSADGSYLINDGDEGVITYTPQPVKQSNGSGANGPNWTRASNFSWTAGDYKKDETFSSTVGDEYSFTFDGVGFDLLAPFSLNHGKGEVFIDDVSAGMTEEEVTAGAEPQQVIFSKKDLAKGEHTVRVRVTGEKFTGSQGTFVPLDAVRIYPETPEAIEPPEPTDAVSWPRIPQKADTKLTIHGRDALAITADLKIGQHDMYYTTSQPFGEALDTSAGMVQTMVGYKGDAGETVLHVEPGYTLAQNAGVTPTYDAATKQLRLNYTHGDPVDVKLTQANGSVLVLRIMDREAAADVWHTSGIQGAGNKTVWVDGAEVVRTVHFDGTVAHITGSVSDASALSVTLPAGITSYTWNGAAVTTAPAPVAVAEPALTWVKGGENPETAVDFDDADWTTADATNALNRYQGPGSNGVVLDSNRYGFFQGSVWYRANYTAASNNPTLTFRGNGGSGVPGHGRNPAFMQVWVNGVYAGARPAAGGTVSVPAPAGSVTAGQKVVVSVVVHNLGHNLDWSDDGLSRQNRGLYEANLAADQSKPIVWKIQGAEHPNAAPDTDRGVYNNGGLYGERAGWYLPGYPDSDWAPATTMVADAPGITWYRSSVDLNVPEGQDVAWRLDIESTKFGPNRATRTDGSQVMLYVNGWHTGIYIGDIGPQKSFTVPAGFINPRGTNDIAVVVAAKTAGMGPQNIRLVPYHNTTGAAGDMEANVAPDYPAQPKPTIAVSATSVAGGTTVTATGTVGALPTLGDGAITALRYEWKAPGEANGTVGEAAKVLNAAGVHQVRTVLVDAVSGQRLSTSDWVDITVDGDGGSTVTVTPTVTVDPT